jgi:hypothetical protein
MVEKVWNNTFWGRVLNHLMDIRKFAYETEQLMNSTEEDWKPHSLPATSILIAQEENESSF